MSMLAGDHNFRERGFCALCVDPIIGDGLELVGQLVLNPLVADFEDRDPLLKIDHNGCRDPGIGADRTPDAEVAIHVSPGSLEEPVTVQPDRASRLDQGIVLGHVAEAEKVSENVEFHEEWAE